MKYDKFEATMTYNIAGYKLYRINVLTVRCGKVVKSVEDNNTTNKHIAKFYLLKAKIETCLGVGYY